jgi:hypothetical protein
MRLVRCGCGGGKMEQKATMFLALFSQASGCTCCIPTAVTMGRTRFCGRGQASGWRAARGGRAASVRTGMSDLVIVNDLPCRRLLPSRPPPPVTSLAPLRRMVVVHIAAPDIIYPNHIPHDCTHVVAPPPQRPASAHRKTELHRRENTFGPAPAPACTPMPLHTTTRTEIRHRA